VLLGVNVSGKSKISNYYFATAALTPKQKVFGFEVAMHDTAAVEMGESPQQATHDVLDLGLREVVLGLEFAHEMTTLKILHDHVQRVV